MGSLGATVLTASDREVGLQSGVLGRATRRAIRLFQKRGQLPVTGLFDEATEAALRAACGGQVSVRSPSLAPEAPPPTEDAEPVAGPEAPPPADGEQIPQTVVVASPAGSQQTETMVSFPLNRTKRKPSRNSRSLANARCEYSGEALCPLPPL